MARYQSLDDQLASLNLEEEENEELVFEGEAIEETNKYEPCLVG